MEDKKTRNRSTANGEGGCKYIEGKKLWCSRITTGWDGTKQIRKAFYGKTKREALSKGTAAQARVMNGQAAMSSDMKLEDWADKWMSDYKSALSPRTVENYEGIIKNEIKSAIGSFPLKNLKPADIQKMLTDLIKKELSKSLISRTKMLTNAMLEAAVDNDLLIKNPCRKIDKIVMPTVFEKEPFTPDEIDVIYSYVPNYLTMHIPHVPHKMGGIIIVLLKTGMRQEELLALQWKHIDFENNTIHIRQAVTIKKGAPILKDTKTFKSNRNIPMHEDAKTVLSAIKPKEGDISDIYVYGTETGGLWLPRNFQRDYKKFFSSAIKAKCKVKYRSAHICRHTFASELRRAGVDPKTISELLGHTRVNLSLNVYTHTDEASKIEAISKL